MLNAVQVSTTFDDASYVEVRGYLSGTAPQGSYSVPFLLMYPKNGPTVGVVDLANSSPIVNNVLPYPIYPALLFLETSFIKRENLTYLSIEWWKYSVDFQANGSIAAGTDGNEIVKDAALLLKNLESHFQLLSSPPHNVTHVIGYGYSQTAAFLRSYVGQGLNAGLEYDGMFTSCAGSTFTLSDNPVTMFNVENFYAKRRPVTPSLIAQEDCKMLTTLTESDVVNGHGLSAATYFSSGMNLRYEFAGTPHVPKDLDPVYDTGLSTQNSISTKQPMRGTFRILLEWVRDDILPPESVTMQGNIITLPFTIPGLGLAGEQFFVPLKNPPAYINFADLQNFNPGGNTVTGILLPPMAVPVAIYRGVDLFPGGHGGKGSQILFTETELDALYTSHGEYVTQVVQAANQSLYSRWITRPDRDQYIIAAAQSKYGT